MAEVLENEAHWRLHSEFFGKLPGGRSLIGFAHGHCTTEKDVVLSREP
jgi:hypothetical protein